MGAEQRWLPERPAPRRGNQTNTAIDSIHRNRKFIICRIPPARNLYNKKEKIQTDDLKNIPLRILRKPWKLNLSIGLRNVKCAANVFILMKDGAPAHKKSIMGNLS